MSLSCNMMVGALTELDAGVLLTDVLALLVGEEHVGRETTLRCVRVYKTGSAYRSSKTACRNAFREWAIDIPFLALRPFSTLAPFFAAALGIFVDLARAMLVIDHNGTK